MDYLCCGKIYWRCNVLHNKVCSTLLTNVIKNCAQKFVRMDIEDAALKYLQHTCYMNIHLVVDDLSPYKVIESLRKIVFI